MAPLHCYKRTNTHPDCGEAFAYEEEFSPSLIGDVCVPHKIYVKTEESAVQGLCYSGNFHFFMKNYDMKFLLRLRFCELGYLFKAVEAAVLLLQVLCKRKHDVFRSLFIFQYRYSQHKHHPRVVMFYTSL